MPINRDELRRVGDGVLQVPDKPDLTAEYTVEQTTDGKTMVTAHFQANP